MYGDPLLIRKYVIKLSLNEQEFGRLEKLANDRHQLKASLVRELLMNEIRRLESKHPEIAKKVA